ncbi:hypothetical protein G7Y89_g1018 [Cudoniella acicularis]|uniref:NAD-dependent epimerase/dehydratase domain-containing protein n=1 Tax=Cudoniella acicularis TaxID=354080 RepID=A0A8H4RW30_9HELO|nr:hypothetical protein G7Y89_g1018 [Cudoniella acicularis]
MADPKINTVLVTGANGYIGNAVARSFASSGFTTYGLVRSKAALYSLATNEIIPVLGTFTDLSFLSKLEEEGVVFDIIVSTTEEITNYIPHYKNVVKLLRTVATSSNKSGVRPLVLFTSGCKDYGMSPYLASSPELAPHTEESPLNPSPFAVDRANYAVKIFEHVDLFDAAVLRPTNVFGYNSSYYSEFFVAAERAKELGVFEVKENPETVLHACHVDDCGDAYVSLALAPREKVSGQCFSISSYRFETLREIAEAFVKEYAISGGVKFVDGKWGTGSRPDEVRERMIMGYSQWTGSAKIRELTGWRDRRLLFSRGLKQYRIAYEAAIVQGKLKLQNIPSEEVRR